MGYLKLEKIFHRMMSEVIRIQGLDDLTSFFHEDFLDEIPFFSRASDVAFLSRLGRDGAEKLLIEFALTYLHGLIHHEKAKSSMLAAITVVDHGKADILVPNLFVCHGRVEELVEGQFSLNTPKSAFAVKIKNLVNQCDDDDNHEVFQDSKSIARRARVFIGEKRLPEGAIPIAKFAASGGKANGRHGLSSKHT